MLNGGPGFPATRPTRPHGWLKRALDEYHVLLLDQRGTGLSSPRTFQTLAGMEPEAQAEHLRHFRADSIVRDAELARRELIGDEQWSVLGQSFGGFCTLTYLSLAPEGIREAFVTGGLPPLDRTADDVYRATFERLEWHIDRYFDRYPDDRARWEAVLEHVDGTGERFPGGAPASRRVLRSLGRELGMSDGPEKLHYLVEHAFSAGAGRLSATFLRAAESELTHTANTLFAVLHEPIYAQGEAPRWAAQRVLDERAEEPFFTGEMIFPWMFEEDPTLGPLREAAHLLAESDAWPALYDAGRLAANEVPVAAAVYLNDMYVESAFSLETAGRVGSLETLPTDEFDHDGVHVGPVLDRLIELRRERA
jgi:pimeloyl-ACP methyl ester carboxylesterase